MKIDELADYLSNLDEVKRHEQLSEGINNNSILKRKHDELLEAQREFVKKNDEKTKEAYRKALDEFLQFPFMEEYLELTDYLNNTLHLIATTINDNINKE